jgi:aminopeptidase-like protein
MAQLFDVLSPDGFSINRNSFFANEEVAKKGIEDFAKRYENQGYYSTSNREQISLDELKEHCRIVPIEVSQEDIDEDLIEIINE